jgi:hypothetical protein
MFEIPDAPLSVTRLREGCVSPSMQRRPVPLRQSVGILATVAPGA